MLENDCLAIEVSTFGAELQSIRDKATGFEYLWYGDKTYWGRRSPVLFPIVGKVWEGRMRYQGAEYLLSQHGFARDMEFELVSETETEVRYRLVSTEETLKKYPYQFVLEIAYRLHDNKVDVIWEVTNPSDKDICFQIGAHPAFYYPDYEKVNDLIVDNQYTTAISTLLNEYAVKNIYYGIGLPTIKHKKKSQDSAILVDFIIGVEDDRTISLLHNPRGIVF